MSWLSDAICPRDTFAFGELTIEPIGTGWTIRGPVSSAQSQAIDASAGGLRQWIRFDASGRYRPLTGARSLAADRSAEARDDAALVAALETIYPLSTRHITQAAEGTLQPRSLDSVLARQSGRYETAAGLSEAGRHAAVDVLCVRTPVWEGAALPAHTCSIIPCPEPCSVMVSFCREVASWEEVPPRPVPPDRGIGFADFESPGNELREFWLSKRRQTADKGAN